MTTPLARTIPLRPDLPLTLSETGSGRPALILHGGGGPGTVASLAAHLAATMRAITPTYSGWNGAARPEWFSGIDDLAPAYLQYLEDQGLRDVLLIGNSVGGWIASEMAVRDTAGRITGLVLIDAVGIEVAGEPVRDVFALDARGVAEYSFHDADRYFVDPSSFSAAQLATQRANMDTLRVVAGDPYMHDPQLLRRLKRVRVPVLALWGDSDRIVTPAYGAAYARAFPDARFEIVTDAGHLPQIEQPGATFALIDAYVRGQSEPVSAS